MVSAVWLPLGPWIASVPLIPCTLPDKPTTTLSVPLCPLMVISAVVPWMLTVSFPVPLSSVVIAARLPLAPIVSLTVKVLPPLPLMTSSDLMAGVE